MKVSVELGDDVLSVADELTSRSGQPRDEVIAEAVRQQVASTMFADLFVERDDGLSDDDTIMEAERSAMRTERHQGDQQGRPAAP